MYWVYCGQQKCIIICICNEKIYNISYKIYNKLMILHSYAFIHVLFILRMLFSYSIAFQNCVHSNEENQILFIQ